MPLMLAIKKGEDFFVGNRRFVLSTITPNEVVFGMDGDEVTVGVDWMSPCDGVKLAIAKIGQGGLRSAKVAVDAPDFRVLRGKLYRDE